MALAYVLWIVALFALLVGGLETSTRTQVELTRNLAAQAQADALADGAINLLVAEISSRSADEVRVGARALALPTGQANVTVTDLAGRVDVNTASPELIARTLQAAGAEADLSAAIAARIVARRGGPEGAQRPILILDELMRIPGVTSALYARLEGMMTTKGGHRVVDAAVASPQVVLALAGLNADAARAYLAERAQGGRFTRLAAPESGPVVGAGFELRAEAVGPGGARAVRTAVVKLARADRRDEGLRVVDWQLERAD